MPHELRPGLLAAPPAIIQAEKYLTACDVTSAPVLSHLLPSSVLGLSSFLISYVEMKNSFTAMALNENTRQNK
jgi:hypothetical protein